MKAALVLNPIAGQGKPVSVQDRIQADLDKYGLDAEILVTAKAGDGTSLARDAVGRGFDLIIAAGGDGTVKEVVNGIAGTGARLGIVPVGSVNVLARELKIPLDSGKAIRTIAEGKEKAIDLGQANDHFFTLMAGFGFDAEVVANVIQPLKDIIGTSAYVLKALETIASYQATDITLEMPDGTYSTKAFLAIVANARTYTYHLNIAPLALPDDGLLDICVFERPDTDRIGFIRQIADVFINRHIYHPAVSYFKTPHVVVKSSPDVMVQLDGDAFTTTPVEIKAIPHALSVIVPSED